MSNLQDTSPFYKSIRPFLMGGFSASTATCIIQPIDMVKVRIQLMEGSKGGTKVQSNPFIVGSTLIKNEGIGALYKGLSAGLVRQLTYGTARLGIFRTLTTKFTPEGKTAADISFGTKFGCSVVAGGLGALIGTPADTALVRMQADTVLPVEQRHGYKNAFDALYKMAKTEGFKGFFTGASPTVLRGLSLNVGMLTTYDSLQQYNRSWAGDGQLNRFSSGFLSGWFASTLCLPFDFLKTRIQKQKRLPDGTYPYKGVVDCAQKIIKNEGILALYQGYPTFVMRVTPHIMFTWVIMDNVADYLKKNDL